MSSSWDVVCDCECAEESSGSLTFAASTEWCSVGVGVWDVIEYAALDYEGGVPDVAWYSAMSGYMCAVSVHCNDVHIG